MLRRRCSIPRPETETLVELALELASDAMRDARVLDLGTGSGAIALAIAHERPRAHVVATDVSAAALAVARDNAARLALGQRGAASRPTGSTARFDGPFDVIVSNPPYVAAGRSALARGRRALRAVVGAGPRTVRDSPRCARSSSGAPQHLVAGGALAVEHGYDQSDAVQELLRDAGFADIVVRRDLAGIPRVAGGRRT